LPHTIDASGRIASRSIMPGDSGACAKRRTAASSTPALITVAMYAVTGMLAPS
jgi:hypothetical protein